MTRSLHKWVLAAILLIAAGTRFVGLDHHLRRAGPDFDEANNFVEPVQEMWAAPTLNPTVYTGYPGFFNWLAFLPIGAGQRIAGEVGAYVGGRSLVALASVASVLLAYLLAKQLAGVGAGLLASALLCVSRGEIRSAHYITPDAVVATSALLMLLLAARGAMSPRLAIALGGLGGLSVATKYTGLFLAPGIATAIAWDRRRWWLGVLALAAAAVAFAVAAPYAVARMGGGEVGGGFSRAVGDYFGSGYSSNRAGGANGGALTSVAWLLFVNLGPMGVLLAAVGAALHRPWKTVAPCVAVVLGGVLAMLPAKLVYPRHVLTVSAAAAVLAALGVAVLARKAKGTNGAPVVGGLLAAAVLSAPTVDGLRLAVRYSRTPAIDSAASYIEARTDAPSLVGTTLPRLRLDPDRFEVRSAGPDVPRAVLGHYPLLVVRPDEAGDWPVQAAFDGDEEQPLVVVRPPHVAVAAWPLQWMSDGGGAKLESVPREPFSVERIEIEGDATALRSIVLEGRLAGNPQFVALPRWPLRPGRLARQRPGVATGQIYVVWPPAAVESLRIRHGGAALTKIRVLGRPTSSGT